MCQHPEVHGASHFTRLTLFVKPSSDRLRATLTASHYRTACRALPDLAMLAANEERQETDSRADEAANDRQQEYDRDTRRQHQQCDA